MWQDPWCLTISTNKFGALQTIFICDAYGWGFLGCCFFVFNKVWIYSKQGSGKREFFVYSICPRTFIHSSYPSLVGALRHFLHVLEKWVFDTIAVMNSVLATWSVFLCLNILGWQNRPWGSNILHGTKRRNILLLTQFYLKFLLAILFEKCSGTWKQHFHRQL